MTFEEGIIILNYFRIHLPSKGFTNVRLVSSSSSYTELTSREYFLPIACDSDETYYIYFNSVNKAGEYSKASSISIISAADFALHSTANIKKLHLDYAFFSNDRGQLESELQRFIDIL